MLRSLALGGVLVALLATSCSRVDTAAGGRHPWTQPDLLRIAMSGAPNTLNPILSTQQVEVFAEAFVYDPLIATGPDGKDVPILAREVPTQENGGISRDGLSITYHLRTNVKWQDGAPFSSRDVAFTVAAILNPKTNVATRHGYDQIARVDTPDPATAIFRLKRPFAPAVHSLFAPSDSPQFILPAHLLEKYGSLDRIAFNGQPVGTGPFTVTKWIRGDRIEYVANDGYFQGKPHLRRIELRIVPDENTIVNQMRAHELDYFYQATPRTYPQLKDAGGVDVTLTPFNGNDAIIVNTTRPPLDDARVRRAIGLALDKERLVQTITFGTAVAATEDLPSFMWAHDPKAGTAKRELAQASALLDAAGWHRGADGIRTKNGRRLALGLAYRSDSITDRERSVVIASNLKDGGIDVQTRGYQTSLLYAPAAEGGILAGGKYDLGLQTWFAGVDPDDSTQLLCSERAPAGYNWARYCSKALDAAETIALSHYDRPTRAKAYAQVQTILANEAPFIYLWWPRAITATNSDLKNVKPNGIVDPWNAWEWTF